MTTRAATAVIVRVAMLTNEGDERAVHYGPFLPHVGSATTSFMNTIERELEGSGRYRHWDVTVESVFIARTNRTARFARHDNWPDTDDTPSRPLPARGIAVPGE